MLRLFSDTRLAAALIPPLLFLSAAAAGCSFSSIAPTPTRPPPLPTPDRLYTPTPLSAAATPPAPGSSGEPGEPGEEDRPGAASRAPSVPGNPGPTPGADGETPQGTGGSGQGGAATPATAATVEEQARRVMESMFTASGRVNPGAVASAAVIDHPGLVPVLIEAAARTFDYETAIEIANSLERITGERVGGDFVLVAPWFEWMGRQEDLPELPGFDAWKGEIYGVIDPSFREFFYEGVKHTVPLWSPMWGGVRKDGIPPLENPKVIPASEADYLEADEPVFGIVVNGEARAYPWRIMAWHELANDVVGGKHISVVF